MSPPECHASRITGIGSAFPEDRVGNDEVCEKIDSNDEWIRDRTGIAERRISRRGDPTEVNSSLGLKAALRALRMSGKKPADVDCILYATCTPDTIIPATGCWLQLKLGAKRAWAVDLNAACSGFVFGLSHADCHIRSGHVRTALVVGSEVTSAFVDWEDRNSCILFGDGAGAAVLERCATDSPSRILSTHLGSDGSLWDLFHLPAGGSALEVTPEVHAQKLDKMKMKGNEIFKVAVKTLADYAVMALDANGVKVEDVDWLVPHQANQRIIEAVARRLGFPMSKVVVNLDRFGNTSAATVPTALDEAVRDGRIQPGNLVLFAVFGAGLTFGSALLRW